MHPAPRIDPVAGMSNELPYLPFFVSDFLVTVGTWPAERVGAYTLALFYQFEHGGLPVENESEFARILHVSRPTARRLWAEISYKFHKRADGLWWNQRLEDVRATARRQMEKATTRAQAGAAARWGKGANGAQARSQAMLEHSSSNAIQLKESTTPPQPPSPRGARPSLRKITSQERARAEALRKRCGGCPHEKPKCESVEFCIGLIVQHWRHEEANGQAEYLGDVK